MRENPPVFYFNDVVKVYLMIHIAKCIFATPVAILKNVPKKYVCVTAEAQFITKLPGFPVIICH